MTRGVDTHCGYCALQCGISVERTPYGVSLEPRSFPTNGGGLCQKGWTAAEVLGAPGRLTTPLVRNADGRLRPTPWDEALDTVIARLGAVQDRYGREAVAVFGGGGLTNEKAYQLGKLARVALRTPHIDYNGRFCMASAAAAARRTLGADRGLPFPLTDLGSAGAVLLLGANPAETMPPAMRHIGACAGHGGLIVVDPRETPTARQALDSNGLHLQPRPGTDLVLLLAMIHVVFADKLADEEYLADRTAGSAELRASVAEWWPERAEQATGVPHRLIRQATARLAASRPATGRADGAYVLTGRGVEQSTRGTDTATAAINLALTLGLVGRPGSGYGALTGQGNGQGGREHGQKSDQLPGYRSITDPDARIHVASVWQVEPDDLPGPGRPAVELLADLGVGTHALLVHGSNPAVSAPRADQVRERLSGLDLLVVSDFFLSETAELADVVLPVTQWAEEEGTLTSLEGRLLRRRAALAPPAGVRPELQVMAELAIRLNAPGSWSAHPRVVFDELARASAGGPADYSGVTWDRLDAGEALYWPCPSAPEGAPAHPGTPRLFTDGFPTADGRARLTVVTADGPAVEPSTEHPFHLITGRTLAHYQTGVQTRQVQSLRAAKSEPYVEMCPETAAGLGITDGDQVEVTSEHGRAQARASVVGSIRPDTVFMPFHWAESCLNNVIGDGTDPISGMPELKLAVVYLRKVGAT